LILYKLTRWAASTVATLQTVWSWAGKGEWRVTEGVACSCLWGSWRCL